MVTKKVLNFTIFFDCFPYTFFLISASLGYLKTVQWNKHGDGSCKILILSK